MLVVAIVGGGPAGCWAALQLARAGINVQFIVGQRTAKAYDETLSARATELAPYAAVVSGHKSGWGGPEIYETAAMMSPWGGERLVSRPALDLALQDCASNAGAAVVHGKVVQVKGAAGDWRLALDSGQEIGATIVVDATGRVRRIARRLGAARARRFDRLVGYPVRLRCTRDGRAEACTYVLSDREGWWFLGPGNDDHRYALFFTDSDMAARSCLGTIAASWANIRDNLQAPAYLTQVMAPQLAHSEALDQPWGAGWLAIGDAAASFDPLSSSGLYFAKTSAEWASQAIQDEDFRAFGDAVSDHVDAFLASQRRVYWGERRFADYIFWQRRHGERVH